MVWVVRESCGGRIAKYAAPDTKETCSSSTAGLGSSLGAKASPELGERIVEASALGFGSWQE